MHRRSDEARKQFSVTTVRMTEINGGVILELESDPLIGISRADRKAISDPNNEYAKKDLWLWAAGGVLTVYSPYNGKKFLALVLRNSGAPDYGGHLTLASGLSSSYEEFFNPTLIAIREGIEEVATVIDGQITTLSLEPAFEEIAWDVFEKQLSRARKFKGLKVCDTPLYVSAEFIKTDEQKLDIVHGKRFSSHQGIICLSPKNRGIDLLKIIQVNLPPGETIFFDCEDTKQGPLDRTIVVFPLEQIKMFKQGDATMKISGASMIFKSCKSVSADPKKCYPCTPVLEKTLKVLLPEQK